MTNKLTLIRVPTRHGLVQGRGYEFDSLIWSTNYDGKWGKKIVISRHDFERQRLRWCQVMDIGTFDPAGGTAVLKLAEESARDRTNAGVAYIDIIYSWREWDLLNNREIRTLRLCTDPFEKYSTGQ